MKPEHFKKVTGSCDGCFFENPPYDCGDECADLVNQLEVIHGSCKLSTPMHHYLFADDLTVDGAIDGAIDGAKTYKKSKK